MEKLNMIDKAQKLEDFYSDNEKLMIRLANYISCSINLPLEEYDYRYRRGRSSFINGEAALHFKVLHNSFLGEVIWKKIEDAFPLDLDGYHFELLSIFDFDWDDDRTWEPGISLRVLKDGQPI